VETADPWHRLDAHLEDVRRAEGELPETVRLAEIVPEDLNRIVAVQLVAIPTDRAERQEAAVGLLIPLLRVAGPAQDVADRGIVARRIEAARIDAVDRHRGRDLVVAPRPIPDRDEAVVVELKR